MSCTTTRPDVCPAATAGRDRMSRVTSFSCNARTAGATARYVLPFPAGPTANVTVALRIASTYCFCPSVFGATPLPRPVRSRSPSTCVGRASSPLMSSIERPTDDAVSSCPLSSSSISSSNSSATRSVSRGGPEIVISLPRTTMCESNAASTSFNSSSRWPRRATMFWSPGTRIFTCVASAKRSSLGWYPVPPRSEWIVIRRPDLKMGILPLGPDGHAVRLARSPRRPGHLPPPQQVEVQVEYRLARVGSDVRNEAPSALVDPLGAREVSGRVDDVREHLSVVVRDRRQVLDVVLRDQEDVCGRLRIRVAERDDGVGLVNDLRRDLVIGDLAEDALRVSVWTHDPETSRGDEGQLSRTPACPPAPLGARPGARAAPAPASNPASAS